MRSRTPVAAVCVATLIAALSACGGGPEARPLGEKVDLGYVNAGTSTATDLAVTVTAVREGTVEELEESGLQFDEDEKNLVPYYVDATYENVGDESVPRDMRVSVEDGEDNLISPTVVLDFAGKNGKGGPCPDVNDGNLEPGQGFDDCTLFLVSPGVDIARVSFLSQVDGEEPEFVYWNAQE